jgi:hypothetical protein
MSGIRIRIGAALDAGVLLIFVPIEKRAEQAGKNIQRSLNASMDGKQATRNAKQTGDALDRELDRMANDILRREARTEAQRTRIHEQGARDRTKIERDAESQAERIAQQAQNAVSRASRQFRDGRGRFSGAASAAGSFAATSVRRGLGIGFGMGRMALRAGAGLAGDVLQGIGLDTSFGSHLANAQELQQRLVDVTNAGYIPGAQGAQGIKQSAADVRKDVYGAANAGAFSQNEVAEGLQKFVGLTGDLETGRNLLKQTAELARATGSHFQVMAEATAEVSNHLGNMPNKAEHVAQVMQVIAGQGKLGALEIKDFARQMAKIAANAPKFEGDEAKTIGDLALMAQEAKMSGGAANAAQAATAVLNFAAGFSTPTTFKHWQAAHLNPYTDTGHTKLRSPEELVLEAIKYSKGDQNKLRQLFPNIRAMTAINPYAKVYGDTQGTDKQKLQAVADEFDRMRSAQLTATEVQRAYTEAMQTSKSKVQIANNKLDEMAAKIHDALIPALGGLVPAIEALTPAVTSIVEGFASMLGTLTQSTDKGHAVDAQKSESESLNFMGTLRQYERTHHVKGPAVPSEIMGEVNLQRAQPLVTAADQRIATLAGSVDTYAKKVAEEGKTYDGASLSKIQQYASGQRTLLGHTEAEASKYLADRATLERLRGTLDDFKSERANLVDMLRNNTLKVEVQNFPSASTQPSGGTDSGTSDEP